MNNFKIFEEEKITQFNQYIEEYLNKIQCHPFLKQAMLYSVKAGGKRIRPLLIFIILDALNTPISDDAYRVGSALELVHTYSLIHDDLPAMDNDDLRRGMPTNHRQFGDDPQQPVLRRMQSERSNFQNLTDMCEAFCIHRLHRSARFWQGCSGSIFGIPP